MRARLQQLDSLRAFAILLVFNVHFFGAVQAQNYFVDKDSWIYQVFATLHAGYIGVDLFFIVSGFLIFKNLYEQTNLQFFEFLKKRIFRLYPVFFVTTLIYFLRYWKNDSGDLIYNLLFLAPLLKNVSNFNGVTWSLAYEWIFYIAAFFIVHTQNKKLSQTQFINRYLIKGFLFSLVIYLLSLVNQSYFIVPEADRLFLIFLGGYLCKDFGITIKKKSDRYLLPALGFFVLVMCYICSQLLPQFFGKFLNWGYFLTAGFLFLAIIKIALRNDFPVLRNKHLVGLGKISYSFYLLHQIVISEVRAFVKPQGQLGLWVAYFLALSATVLLAQLFYNWFERSYFSAKLVKAKESK